MYQLSEPKNRHLVEVRQVSSLPPTQRIEDVLVLTPPELIAAKVLSMVSRPETPKGLQDEVDLRRLLLAFPELKSSRGSVRARLDAAGAFPEAVSAWDELAAQEILPEDDDAGY